MNLKLRCKDRTNLRLSKKNRDFPTLLDSLKERLPRNPPESGAKVTKIKITQNIRAYFYRFFSFTVN
nr:MAG TPA: hypothetical protein [Caudoviricetes sp.]